MEEEEEFNIIGSFKGYNVHFDGRLYYAIIDKKRIVIDETKVCMNSLGRKI